MVLGTIEYAMDQLGVRLIVVLGHSETHPAYEIAYINTCWELARVVDFYQESDGFTI
jgi:hypothetical protein